MPSPSPLATGVFYHIYNRGTNRENIFIQERNYAYFLSLYAKYIEPVAETYVYCLLKNHFHLLVRVRDDLQPKGLSASGAFSNLFNAYAKAINKAYDRTGSLFQHPFGRIPVLTSEYLVQVVRYIHFNPQKHRLASDFRDWNYSSYQAMLSHQATRLQRKDVMDWFDGASGYIAAHQYPVDEQIIAPLTPDDED